MIDKPGVYRIPMTEYQSDPCVRPSLSAGVAFTLVEKTPRHAWLQHPRLNPKWHPETATKFDIGELAHTLLLGDQRKVRIVKADDWRTKAAQAERQAAYENKEIPVLEYQYERAEKMVASARRQLAQHEDGAEWFIPGKGEAEMTLAWQWGSEFLRCRLDWNPAQGNLYPDYKTTGAGAGPDEWGKRQLFDLGADVRAVFYELGIAAVLGTPTPQYRFVVQETEPPYALNVLALSPSARAMALRKVEYAFETWRECLHRNYWPGFPRHTQFIDAPPWREIEFENRMAVVGPPKTLIEAAMKMFEP